MSGAGQTFGLRRLVDIAWPVLTPVGLVGYLAAAPHLSLQMFVLWFTFVVFAPFLIPAWALLSVWWVSRQLRR